MDYSATLNQFAQSLLALAVPIIAAYVARSVKKYYDEKVAQLQAQAGENRWLVDEAIGTAVHAAEQLITGSDAKLTYAIDFTQAYLEKHGVTIDLKLLRGMIEAEVNREFGKTKPAG